MILIGMFDSPFVRRVAISMELLELPFEHRNWSVGRDVAEIKRYNPLGRVPTLVLDDGEVLVESAAILDYLDETVGPARALLPVSGASRRRGLKLMGIATGAADKAVAQLYERVFRPAEKWHQPWLERCHEQMHGALDELERACATVSSQGWLLGSRFQQPDITVACCYTLMLEAVGFDAVRYPALATLVKRCEQMPVFGKYHLPFFKPQTSD